MRGVWCVVLMTGAFDWFPTSRDESVSGADGVDQSSASVWRISCDVSPGPLVGAPVGAPLSPGPLAVIKAAASPVSGLTFGHFLDL
jgi:hypothetical protein